MDRSVDLSRADSIGAAKIYNSSCIEVEGAGTGGAVPANEAVEGMSGISVAIASSVNDAASVKKERKVSSGGDEVDARVDPVGKDVASVKRDTMVSSSGNEVDVRVDSVGDAEIIGSAGADADKELDARSVYVEAVVSTAVTTSSATVESELPFSNASISRSSGLENDGINLVHQNAMRRPRSTSRCFKINKTTKTKKTRAAMMTSLSTQSDFSRAVIRYLEVVRSPSRTSCVEDAERNEADDASDGENYIHELDIHARHIVNSLSTHPVVV